MQREVFILPNGQSFWAWDVQFTAFEQSHETRPCMIYERDGSVRNGTMRYTVESAQVSFRTFPDSLHVGRQGQLSSTVDRFFEVTVSSLEPAGDYVVVFGKATRKLGYERDP